MKHLALTAAALALIATAQSAGAADLPRRDMPVKAPALAPAPYYDWTGFYVGINGGGGWGGSQFDGAFGTPGRFDVRGGLVGGTLGYNLQYGRTVFGLEGDLDWSNLRGSATCLGGFATCQTQNDWLGTTRGRIGYAFDRFMPFVTGGLAFGDIKANVPGFGSASDTKAGWTVGGGAEFALVGNLTAKAEYLHVDLGNFDCSPGCAPSPTNVDFTSNLFRGGLNLRF